MLGTRFGKLIPFAVINQSKHGMGYKMLCVCDCGGYRVSLQRTLLDGHSGSCGCLRKKPRKHGYAVREFGKNGGTPKRLYRIWCAMIQRCHNPKNGAFKYYGGKGITVCDEWRSFENFHSDMATSYRDDLTIHRLNNAIGYCKSNCSWVDRRTQMEHTSRNRNVTINGVTKPVSVWCRELGVKRARVYTRLRDGWGEVEAITTPFKKWTRRNESRNN